MVDGRNSVEVHHYDTAWKAVLQGIMGDLWIGQ